MALCSDNTLCKLNLACRSYDFASCAACNVAAFADRSCNAECTCVCEGNLNLSCRTLRTEDGNVCDLTLRTYESNLFFSKELSRLGKLALVVENCALAEEDFKMLLCNVNVT